MILAHFRTIGLGAIAATGIVAGCAAPAVPVIESSLSESAERKAVQAWWKDRFGNDQLKLVIIEERAKGTDADFLVRGKTESSFRACNYPKATLVPMRVATENASGQRFPEEEVLFVIEEGRVVVSYSHYQRR